VESGLYVTFLDAAEPRDRELPAVGPLDHVVLHGDRLVAERVAVWQAPDMSIAIDRILEAELELQRKTGEEPGGAKRSDMRFAARDGVFVRFVVFSEAPERDALPELGPFTTVTVGPRSVHADGRQLASRVAGEPAQWELSAGAGANAGGELKPDIAFRTPTSAYHGWLAAAPPAFAVRREPAVAPAPPAMTIEPSVTPPPRVEPAFTPSPTIEPAFTPPPRSEAAPTPPPFVELPPREAAVVPPPRVESVFTPPLVTTERLFKPATETVLKPPTAKPAPVPPTPPPPEPPVLTPSDRELIERIDRDRAEETLRARIQEKDRQRSAADAPSEDTSTWSRYRPQAASATADDEASDGEEEGPGLLWRLRFVLIGILLVSAGFYGYTAFRESTAPSTGQQFSFVNVGARFTGSRWEWTINGTQRTPDSGKLKAQGVFLLVRVGATNVATEGAQMTPSDFTLIDPNGVEHAALGVTSGAYQGADNPNSPNMWPPAFRVGTNVTFNVLFDIDPSLGRGMVLAIGDAPKTRVRLD